MSVFGARVLKSKYSHFEKKIGSSFEKIPFVYVSFLCCITLTALIALINFIFSTTSIENSAYITSSIKIIFVIFFGPFLYLKYQASKAYDKDILSERIQQTEQKTPIDELPDNFSIYLRSFNHETPSHDELDWTCEYEAALISALTPKYALMTVGNPGLNLQPLGTHRLHFHADEWEDRVKLLISKSEVIVIRADYSDSVIWEIKSSIALSKPERIKILLNTKAPADDYDEFKKRVEALFPNGLPKFARDAAFIAFDSEWNPRLLKFDEKNTNQSISTKIASVLASHLGVLPNLIRKSGPDIKRIEYYTHRKKYSANRVPLPDVRSSSHPPPKLW